MARSYQEFEPDCKYIEGEAQDVIETQVKDFKKNQMKINFGNNGMLTISGERQNLEKWIRFRKEFKVPKECKAKEIRARLSSGVLYITIPKNTTQPILQQDQVAALPHGPEPSLPVQDKGELKQDSSIQRNQQTAVGDEIAHPTEDAPLAPKSFVSRLKVGRKTALKVASLIVVALVFIVLFYLFKYNNFQILSWGFSSENM